MNRPHYQLHERSITTQQQRAWDTPRLCVVAEFSIGDVHLFRHFSCSKLHECADHVGPHAEGSFEISSRALGLVVVVVCVEGSVFTAVLKASRFKH